MSSIIVSICCITYNHKDFIKKALDGFLMQKTNFNFEVLIHDDASTDGTTDIIKEYQRKYPQIIKPIFQTENQWSKGIQYTDQKWNWPRIQGKYVAFCEGDDYWIDENKLQKQVDFLEKNSDFTICFHPVKVIWENNQKPPETFPKWKNRLFKTIFTFDDIKQNYFIQTCSVMYRWVLKGEEVNFPKNISPGDYYIHLLHAEKGKAKLLPDVMSVYRKHQKGIWWDTGDQSSFYNRNAIQYLSFHKALEQRFNLKKEHDISEIMQRTILSYLDTKSFDKIAIAESFFPETYKRIIDKWFKDGPTDQKKYRRLKFKNLILIVIILFLLLYILKLKYINL